MKLALKSFVLFALCFMMQHGFAQTDKVDSLKLLLKNATNDTSRCNYLFMLTEEADDEEWPLYNDELKKICEKNLRTLPEGTQEYLFYKNFYSDVLNNMGYLANQNGKPAEALEYYSKSLKISEETNNKEAMATLLNNIGAIYNLQGSISKALEQYSRSLKIREEIGDQKGIANSLNNLGIIYDKQGDANRALEYYQRGLEIRRKMNDKQGTSSFLNNIGTIYEKKGDVVKALDCYTQSLSIKKEMKDKRGIATSLNNIGRLFIVQGKHKESLVYLNEALTLRREIDDVSGMAHSLHNIAQAYYLQKNYRQALSCAQQSMELANETGFPESISNAALSLNRIYRATGDFKNALKNYELYIVMRDSIINTQNQKASITRELQYNYDKKAAADSVVNAKQAEVHKAQMQQQQAELKTKRNQQYALYGGLALVMIFAGFMYNRFKVTSKQKTIIELKEKETQQQKHIIEEKHKEITDSINYAERIQRSFLATKELLDSHLLTANGGDYFVLFKPKDVVSGDFYWAATLSSPRGGAAGGGGFEVSGSHNQKQELNPKLFCLATADSTGHGVPGAIMSLLNITSLEKAIENYNDPADILNATRQTIIKRLKKDGSAEGGKDGMDCSLCIFDFENNVLKVAAANNPVWIVRGVASGALRPGSVTTSTTGTLPEVLEGNYEVIEIKPDKMPVGKHDKQDVPFTTHTIQLQSGDVVYTLTDGFPDQFGGDKGKKFMSKNLRELLATNAHLPMPSQKQVLEETFKNWVNNLEQIDDVTLIGIRI